MAHFAKINADNVVEQVIVINNDVIGEPGLVFPETEQPGKDFIANVLNLPGTWMQTSYNGSFRSNFASNGYTYDAEKDAFIEFKRYESWVLNEETNKWEAPVPYPSDGLEYMWDEESVSWVAFPEATVE